MLGLAKNSRLRQAIAEELAEAQREYESTGGPARVFRDFRYQTLESWSTERRVVGKAEYLAKGENPRFIVTSLSRQEQDARGLYEDLYCARGEMENRIKEQQLALFADRTSTQALRSNQLRLYFSSFAYVLIETLRALGLGGTELAQAQCDTIRLKLLKSRRPDPHHGAQCLDRLLRSLSLCEPLPSGAGPSAADPLALLATSDWPVPSLVPGIRKGVRGSLGLRSQNASNHLHLSTETSINYSICLVGISTAAANSSGLLF